MVSFDSHQKILTPAKIPSNPQAGIRARSKTQFHLSIKSWTDDKTTT